MICENCGNEMIKKYDKQIRNCVQTHWTCLYCGCNDISHEFHNHDNHDEELLDEEDEDVEIVLWNDKWVYSRIDRKRRIIHIMNKQCPDMDCCLWLDDTCLVACIRECGKQL